MKSEIKTAIILGGIIVAVIGGLSGVFSSIETSQSLGLNDDKELDQAIQNIDKSRFKKAPTLTGIAGYINTSPEKLQDELNGKVVLYDIWTYSCINCVRTLPYITEWNEKYSDEGLVIVGIHSPEFEFEKNEKNVRMAVDKHGITYPVVLDNDMEIWKAFQNKYWPRKYLADSEGYIRYDHIGEGKYEETEKMIQQLLQERANLVGLNIAAAEPLVDLEEFQHTSFRTPELYFGYNFAQGRNQLGNPEGFNPENEVSYSLPDNLQQHYFYLEGTWRNLEGSMKLVSDSGSIKLPFHAKEVNIVTANEGKITILIDGSPIKPEYSGKDVISGELILAEPGLYNIVSSEEASSHVLEIVVNEPGFEIYTFTFG
jgi:thiol-disulfide isomerase/thioredoxin